MARKTGRTRTISMSYTITGSVTLIPDDQIVVSGGQNTIQCTGYAYGVSFLVTASVIKPGEHASDPRPKAQCSVRISTPWDVALGGGDVSYTYSHDCSGSVRITVALEEWESEDGLDPALIDPRTGTARALYDPQADGLADGEPARSRGLTERVVSYTGTISVGGGSATVTSYANGRFAEADYTAGCQVSGGDSLSCTASPSGLTHVYPNPRSISVGAATASVSSQGCSIAPNGGPISLAQWNVGAQLDLVLTGRLRSMEGAYTGGNKTIRWQNHMVPAADGVHTVYMYEDVSASGGTMNATRSLYAYSALLKFEGIDEPQYRDEFNNQFYGSRVWLPNPGENGDVPGDWTVGILGDGYDALHLSHADHVVLSDTWSAGPNVTIVSPTTFTVPTNKSGTMWLYPTDGAWVMMGYGWLRFKIGAVNSAQSLLVTINQKQYVLSVPHGDTTYAWVNLQQPINLSGTDTQELVEPFTGAGLMPDAEGSMWGINFANAIQISNMSGAETYVIDEVALARKSTAIADFGCAFLYWTQLYPRVENDNQKTTTYIKPFCSTHVDGRRWDTYDHVHIHVENTNTGAVSDTYQYQSIGSLATKINQIPGFTATVLPDKNDFLNSTLEATCLMGRDGSVYYSGAWHEGWGIDISGTATIRAQPVFDEYGYYPGAGDTHSGAYGAVVIRCNKNIRPGVEGLVLPQGGGDPTPGLTVNATRYPGGASAGTGSTDSTGHYQTGQPYGLGMLPQKSQLMSGSNPYAITTWHPRFRSRVSFLSGSGVGVSINPHNLQDAYGRYHRVSVHANDLYYRRSNSTVPLPIFAVETQVTTSADVRDPRVAVLTNGSTHVLYARTTSGSQHVYLRTSEGDDGLTWTSEQIAFGGGKRPAMATSPDGALLTAAYVSGSIQASIQQPGQASAGSPVTVASADDDSFSVTYGHDGAGRWYMAYVSGGNVYLRHSTDDASTWSTPVLIMGGKHPVVTASHSGTVWVSAYSSGHIVARMKGAGDAAFGSAYTLSSGGSGISVADDGFGLACGVDDRVVLTAVVGSDSEPSDWWSTDDGATFTRC